MGNVVTTHKSSPQARSDLPDYTGSAFDHIARVRCINDASELRAMMPNINKPKQIRAADAVEGLCWRFMRTKAAEGELDCRFVIPHVIPGVPVFVPEDMLQILYRKLSVTPGIKVFGEEDTLTLVISWANTKS